MNLSEPISLNNLREMAMLEALGLLDSVDESKFEESFGGLSPALQAELLDLQAAVAAEIAAAGDEETGPRASIQGARPTGVGNRTR